MLFPCVGECVMALTSRLQVLLLLLVLAAPLIAAQDPPADDGRRTFEVCNPDNRPCASAYICLTASLKSCIRSDVECRCIPNNRQLSCNKPSRCPDGEDCAVSATGRSLCFGCRYLREKKKEVTLVDPTSLKCRSAPPTPPPNGPLGRSFDLCAIENPCAPDYRCVSNLSDDNCNEDNIICRCLADKQVEDCSGDDDCPEGETCATDTAFNTRVCASCTYIAIQPELQPAEESVKCANVEKRPLPVYNGSPNGFSFDVCRTDLTCVEPRTCRIDSSGLPSCNAQEASHGHCYCLEKKPTENGCDESLDCPRGEVCAQRDSDPFRLCASASLIRSLDPLDRRVFGNPARQTPVPDGSGVSGDACLFDWECDSPRRCTHVEDEFGGCAGREGCYCRGVLPAVCERDDECSTGERCVNYRGARSDSFCMSKRALRVDPDAVQIRQLSGEPDLFVTDGLTGDQCSGDRDCAQRTGVPRECIHIAERVARCEGRPSCFCVVTDARNACTTSANCVDGEKCVVVRGSLVSGRGVCRSERAVLRDGRELYVELPAPSPSASVSGIPAPIGPVVPPNNLDDDLEDDSLLDASGEAEISSSPEPSEDVEPVCVDARLLAHLPARDLVFRTARSARVLCDVHGNCATRGHMVVYQGRAMMMRSYCALVGQCRGRRMLVNSPRMRVGLRVMTRVAALQFTALAARFESGVEEVVLTRLVHMGM